MEKLSSQRGRARAAAMIALALGMLLMGNVREAAADNSGEGPVPYDLNGDGVFDIDDVKYAAGIIVGREITDAEADVDGDGKITVQDVIHLSKWVVDGTPTPGPTATPTPSPTPAGPDTFDIEDYFILTTSSEWQYRADDGASPEDDFNWTITGTVQSPDAKTITPINYIVLDPGDDREGDQDFWQIDANGDLYFYGIHKGKATSQLAGNKDNWLSDPVKGGGRNMTIGDIVTDTGSGSFWGKLGPFEQLVPAAVTATLKYTGRESVNTHMGVFHNCIRVEVDIDITSLNSIPINVEVRGSTFWLKEGVGMVKQDQQPDGNDAETHSIQAGNVGGTAITPDAPPPAAPPHPAAAGQ